MTYNQTKVNGMPMPLLMGCTKPSSIEVLEEGPKSLYNPITQIVEIECGRTVGTKSLRPSASVKKMPSGNKYVLTDKKNEIDDSKHVV
jgi:hypothetical protein